jgi:hypothetical protein
MSAHGSASPRKAFNGLPGMISRIRSRMMPYAW